MSKPNRSRPSDRLGRRMEFSFSDFCAVQVNGSEYMLLTFCIPAFRAIWDGIGGSVARVDTL
jgi:hypothetical protein